MLLIIFLYGFFYFVVLLLFVLLSLSKVIALSIIAAASYLFFSIFNAIPKNKVKITAIDSKSKKA